MKNLKFLEKWLLETGNENKTIFEHVLFIIWKNYNDILLGSDCRLLPSWINYADKYFVGIDLFNFIPDNLSMYCTSEMIWKTKDAFSVEHNSTRENRPIKRFYWTEINPLQTDWCNQINPLKPQTYSTLSVQGLNFFCLNFFLWFVCNSYIYQKSVKCKKKHLPKHLATAKDKANCHYIEA